MPANHDITINAAVNILLAAVAETKNKRGVKRNTAFKVAASSRQALTQP